MWISLRMRVRVIALRKVRTIPFLSLKTMISFLFLGASKKCQAINEAGFSKCPRYTLTLREGRGGEEYLMLTDTQGICLFALVMMWLCANTSFTVTMPTHCCLTLDALCKIQLMFCNPFIYSVFLTYIIYHL